MNTDKLQPYTGFFQPFCAYFGLFWFSLVTLFYGYSFAKTPVTAAKFFQNYTMQVVDPILFIGWKLVKKTKWKSPREVDLVWERPTIGKFTCYANSNLPVLMILRRLRRVIH
jgi:yeast amino acid transporter